MPIASSNSTALITGGSTGIGLALASRFLSAGSTVIVTGRSQQRLDEAAAAHPGLLTIANDMSRAEDRSALAAQLHREHPFLNIVINNAGIQRRVALAEDDAPWTERQAEIDVLLSGPVHLNHLLVPHLLATGRPSLVANVTSGGAYVPQPFAPVYAACKAALHSYTVTLRHALQGTPCRVVEIAPPAVQTALAGPGASHGVPLNDFADAIFARLTETEEDFIGYGMTDSEAFHAAAEPYAEMFKGFAGRFPVKTYD
ncbi:SDR family NAD(P)-dependent oxidoreductase [Martelella alba]|uniref:SDR family NAD(P)-dependent oxidoreductase n=1 Tax=Martelella alba TaxID=2590451 RepID=A0A506UBN9_9HYPH|nr:SDR family NAD(P)-dependent oxidoreductase [Martelella alba]TPW31813.1 SDR family NAD(P)-dependent oxidoreductase [Martelella alba]